MDYQIDHIYTKNQTHPRIMPNDVQLEFIQFEQLHYSLYPPIPEKEINVEINNEINNEKEKEEKQQKKVKKSVTDILFSQK